MQQLLCETAQRCGDKLNLVVKNGPCHTGYGNSDAQVILIDCFHMTRVIFSLSLSVFFSSLCHDPLFLFSSVSGLGPRQAADGKLHMGRMPV